MNRCRLVYLINKVDYGGAEMGMIRLLSGLDTARFDTTVITLKAANPDLTSQLPREIDVIELRCADRPAVQEFHRALTRFERADVLVNSLFPSILIGSVLGHLTSVPETYVWRHNTPGMSRLRTWLNQGCVALADGVFADSAATKTLVETWGVPSEDISVLPLAGIDVESYPAVTHSNDRPIRVGTVGRLIEQKGYDRVVACANDLPDCEFHVVGDGPLRPKLEAGPNNLILHGRVTQDHLTTLWQRFDIYFQPSRFEGLCITAIEAMAAGLPVVASATDGLTESVIHGQTGYLIESGDRTGYEQAINRLAQDADLRAQLGGAGRERVEEHYSQSALIEAFEGAISMPIPSHERSRPMHQASVAE